LILVTGYTGVIGTAVDRFLSPQSEIVGLSYDCLNTKLECCDIRDLDSLRKIVLHYKPTVIVHMAGIKDINRCESEPNLCYSINVLGTKNILELANYVDALFIYVSSDYVFDGKIGDYKESDPTSPIQVYGRTKVECEELVGQSDNGVILRTAGVYGLGSPRPTFLEFVISNCVNGNSLDLYDDLYNSPTYLPDLCFGVQKLIELRKPGVYHLCGKDSINRYEFAVEIAKYYGFDHALLRPTTGVKNEPLRPSNLSLSGSNTNKILNCCPNSVSEALRFLSRDYPDLE